MLSDSRILAGIKPKKLARSRSQTLRTSTQMFEVVKFCGVKKKQQTNKTRKYQIIIISNDTIRLLITHM